MFKILHVKLYINVYTYKVEIICQINEILHFPANGKCLGLIKQKK